jgi:hypothetical protein
MPIFPVYFIISSYFLFTQFEACRTSLKTETYDMLSEKYANKKIILAQLDIYAAWLICGVKKFIQIIQALNIPAPPLSI